MSHVALDISKSLAVPAAAAPHGAVAAGSARNGFEGHLQRASHEGSKTKDHSAENAPAEGARTANSFSDDSQGKPAPSKSSADLHMPPANDSAASADSAGSPEDKSRSNESSAIAANSADQPGAVVTKDKSNPDLGQTPPIASQLVAAAAIVVTSAPLVTAADAMPPQADTAQPAQSPLVSVAKPAPTNPAAPSNASATAGASGPLADEIATATAIPPAPTCDPTNTASSTVVAVSAAVSQTSDAAANSPDQPAIQLQVNSPDGAPALVVASSATITDVMANATSNSAAVGIGPATADKATPAPTAAPDSAPPIRNPNPAKDAAAIASVVDVQVMAAVVSMMSAAADGQPTETSGAGSARKQAAAAAIDSLAAKSATQSPGQTPVTTAAAQPSDSAGAQSPAQPAASAGAGEVDRVRFLQRVSSAFRTADDQGGQIRLRLSPPELGSMRLELTVRNGLMTAHVQAETDTARNMLLDHLPQLRERLADHNIKIDHFDVELMNQSNGGTPQNFAGQRDSGYPLGQTGPRRTASGAITAATISRLSGVRNRDGGLDVTV